MAQGHMCFVCLKLYYKVCAEEQSVEQETLNFKWKKTVNPSRSCRMLHDLDHSTASLAHRLSTSSISRDNSLRLMKGSVKGGLYCHHPTIPVITLRSSAPTIN